MKHIVCLKRTYRLSKHRLSNGKWSSILILLNKLSKLSFPVARKPFSKHLGLYLDERLSFSEHIRENIAKAMNGISLFKFLSKYVSKDILNMSKVKGQRVNLTNLLEQVKYKATLVVSGCWHGTI